MTIGKGTTWGAPCRLPSAAPVFDSDAALFRWLNEDPTTPLPTTPEPNTPAPTIGLTGGSLWTMLGGASCVGRIHSDAAIGYPCDVIAVRTEVGDFRFAATLAAHDRLWHRVAVAMNVQDLGPYRFGHRAHPGDGLVDIYETQLPLQQRFLVAKRAKLGAHLPHPLIRERRVSTARVDLKRSTAFWLDGVSCGRSSCFELTVEPDALTVVL